MKIVINSIRFNRSLVDGPGVRTVLFLQGCDIRCKGCQNSSAWNIDDGVVTDTDKLAALLKRECINKKLTISGGEPLMQAEAVADLITKLNDFDIALYTGHDRGEVPENILKNIKYLKTGRYIAGQRTTTKPYVGSKNQIFEEVNHAQQR